MIHKQEQGAKRKEKGMIIPLLKMPV